MQHHIDPIWGCDLIQINTKSFTIPTSNFPRLIYPSCSIFEIKYYKLYGLKYKKQTTCLIYSIFGKREKEEVFLLQLFGEGESYTVEDRFQTLFRPPQNINVERFELRTSFRTFGRPTI